MGAINEQYPVIHFQGTQSLFHRFNGDTAGLFEITQRCDDWFRPPQFMHAVGEPDSAGAKQVAQPFLDRNRAAFDGGGERSVLRWFISKGLPKALGASSRASRAYRAENLALLYARLGEIDEALPWLEQAVEGQEEAPHYTRQRGGVASIALEYALYPFMVPPFGGADSFRSVSSGVLRALFRDENESQPHSYAILNIPMRQLACDVEKEHSPQMRMWLA